MVNPTPFGVIFDLDGLLADTEPLWAESARLLLARRGKVWDHALKPLCMGRHPLDVARLLAAHYELEDPPEDLFAERLALVKQLFREETIHPMPGAVELVEDLNQGGVPMAVASGSLTHIVKDVVQQLGLAPALPIQLGSDQVEHGKPAPDIFLLAARRLGLEPERCTVLEDAPAGVEAALAAGMRCFCVPSPGTSLQAAARAHRVLSSLMELSLLDFQ